MSVLRGCMFFGLLVACGIALGQGAIFEQARHAYEKGKPCVIRLNAPGATQVQFDVDGWLPQKVSVQGDIAEYSIDTKRLRVGEYTVRARASKADGTSETVLFPSSITPMHDKERIPVWRWGGGGADPEWWTQRGFTGGFIGIEYPLGELSATSESYMRFLLDRAAEYDFELGFYIESLSAKPLKSNPDVLCLLPDGKRAEEDPYPLEPVVIDYSKRLTDSWISQFADHPGLRHVMFNSEYRTPCCLNPVAVQMAKDEVGLNLADWVKSKWGPGAPAEGEVKDGLIADDNPRYRFLQWWWQRGHGTAPLHEILNGIVKDHNPDLITWHEPYRLAPVRGSHKGLDCIGTWTYGHPDIKRLCYTTYLQAAARPEKQLVHQDITLFVYGEFAVPVGESTSDFSSDFAGKDPYFTAGPDYATEALWLVLSQRPDILCFYSAGKLSPDIPTNDPLYSSPETFDAIGRTCEEVVKPFGPALKKCTRTAPKVAVLMSAVAEWFEAGKRLAGYANEQTLPFATLLMMNHVPFDVLLDEDILEGALDRYSVLVMPRADTLTRGMHDRVVAFASAGGRVVADGSLRASIPGVQMTQFDFTHQKRMSGKELANNNAVTAEEDRTIMEGYARELAPLVSDVPRPADSPSLRVLTNTMDGGGARYHFFVNDDRTYGPRFGKWKLYFEQGVPQTADVSVPLESRPVLYDALRRTQIEYRTENGRAVFPIHMTGARGKLVVALPEAIGAVEVSAPASCSAGEEVNVSIQVNGASGNVLPCVLPIQIDVLDGLGRTTEWGRYTATENGSSDFTFVPALNDASGTWKIRVTDLVAGEVKEVSLNVGPAVGGP